MKHLLLNSCVLKTKIWNVCVRGIASESVVQSIEGTDRNSTLGQRWQQHENEILIAGVEKQELELEKAANAYTEPTRREKWEEIETYCHLNGINRSAEQCRQRWQRLLHAFSKIKHWESCRTPGKPSFWSLKANEKKAEGLSFSLDLETFNAMDAIESRKGVACMTTEFSEAEAVGTESPSSEANAQQQIMEASETQGCTQETITSIASNQEDHALNQDSSTALMKSTQQTNVTHNDDRPMIFVNAINECLNYLKDFVPDSGEPAQVDRGTGVDTLYIGAENMDRTVSTVNLTAEATESVKSKIPAE